MQTNTEFIIHNIRYASNSYGEMVEDDCQPGRIEFERNLRSLGNHIIIVCVQQNSSINNRFATHIRYIRMTTDHQLHTVEYTPTHSYIWTVHMVSE